MDAHNEFLKSIGVEIKTMPDGLRVMEGLTEEKYKLFEDWLYENDENFKDLKHIRGIR
jgi:hypothetical protein